MTFDLYTGALVFTALASFFHLLRWLSTRDRQARMKAQANFTSFMLMSLVCLGVYAFHGDLGQWAGGLAHPVQNMFQASVK